MAYGSDPLTTIPEASLPAGDGNLQPAARAGDAIDKENRPDYECATYQDMKPFWELCRDIKTGTPAIRTKAATYLPRFEAESVLDWEARVAMTFANDHYAQTLEDLVGLVCAEDVAIDPKDAPKELVPLMDNVDGEGNALAVFARQALNDAIDEGHGAIYTDYPDTAALRAELGRELTLQDARDRMLRPYACFYKASDILSWRFVKLGSVHVLQQVVLHECVTRNAGRFGSSEVHRYRMIEQATVLDAQGNALSLGAITFTVYEKRPGEGNAGVQFPIVGQGTIVGPKRIPLRIVYGGTKISRLHSRPFLAGMAFTNVEETQVKSDYAAVMHKCNVPTPIFRGRRMNPDTGQMDAVVMGRGIDVDPQGGAEMLEPSGAALSATRDRLTDIAAQIRRQGGTLHVEDQKMTATEAQIAARQRNAKLARAARSLRDALEGMGADFAAFMGITIAEGQKVGFVVNTDFAQGSFDPFFVQACHDAWKDGALPLEDYLYVLKNGELPDDFDPEKAALLAIAAEAARAAADAQAAAAAGADPTSGAPNPPPSGKPNPPAKSTPSAGGAGGPAGGTDGGNP